MFEELTTLFACNVLAYIVPITDAVPPIHTLYELLSVPEAIFVFTNRLYVFVWFTTLKLFPKAPLFVTLSVLPIETAPVTPNVLAIVTGPVTARVLAIDVGPETEAFPDTFK